MITDEAFTIGMMMGLQRCYMKISGQWDPVRALTIITKHELKLRKAPCARQKLSKLP